jgi:hypothetical protein
MLKILIRLHKFLGCIMFCTISALGPSAHAGKLSMHKSSSDTIAKSQLAIHKMLDDFHDAASKADGKRYFSNFGSDATYVGTDAGEFWSVAEFKEYAAPHFKKGKGWTYKVEERKLKPVPQTDGAVLWFHELLQNKKYGQCRGTGVVQKVKGKWKIHSYHLTFPIPNEIANALVKKIKSFSRSSSKTK